MLMKILNVLKTIVKSIKLLCIIIFFFQFYLFLFTKIQMLEVIQVVHGQGKMKKKLLSGNFEICQGILSFIFMSQKLEIFRLNVRKIWNLNSSIRDSIVKMSKYVKLNFSILLSSHNNGYLKLTINTKFDKLCQGITFLVRKCQVNSLSILCGHLVIR